MTAFGMKYLTWNGFQSCYYRTYCVGGEPTSEHGECSATALEWLYDSIDAVIRPGRAAPWRCSAWSAGRWPAPARR
ncbi:MAG TPA: hypothetical protein VE776_12190, partial [Actinomycetota bacterium]|nr:hypothetical protein [Actinomycetota bacterium]